MDRTQATAALRKQRDLAIQRSEQTGETYRVTLTIPTASELLIAMEKYNPQHNRIENTLMYVKSLEADHPVLAERIRTLLADPSAEP